MTETDWTIPETEEQYKITLQWVKQFEDTLEILEVMRSQSQVHPIPTLTPSNIESEIEAFKRQIEVLKQNAKNYEERHPK